MNCSNCGTQNRPGVKFCEQCGKQLPRAQEAGGDQRFCPNCGQANPANNNFCNNCGTNFTGVSSSPNTQASFGKNFRSLAAWGFGAFLLAFLVFNIWGALNALDAAYEDHTNEAEIIAVNFVQENFPELANAERTAYVANIQGTDFYVVDFVQNDPGGSPRGVRILVDRLLRAVFTYEYIGTK